MTRIGEYQEIRARIMAETLGAHNKPLNGTHTEHKLFWMMQFMDTMRTIQPEAQTLEAAEGAYDSAFNQGRNSAKEQTNE